MKKTMYKSVIS